MDKDFTIDELVELRLDCMYAAQKVERLVMAKLSVKHRERNSQHYTADDINATRKDLEIARTMLHGAAEKLSPTILALAQEAVPA